jgi:hypothetical protein
MPTLASGGRKAQAFLASVEHPAVVATEDGRRSFLLWGVCSPITPHEQ